MKWKTGPNGKSLAERFNEKVDRSGGADACWLWMASRRGGYGQIGSGVGKGVLLAHHVAVQLDGREIPSGAVVMHTCDNPACCNPAAIAERYGCSAVAISAIANGRTYSWLPSRVL